MGCKLELPEWLKLLLPDEPISGLCFLRPKRYAFRIPRGPGISRRFGPDWSSSFRPRVAMEPRNIKSNSVHVGTDLGSIFHLWAFFVEGGSS